MGLRGPQPKPAELRQRRNKVSTATTLEAVPSKRIKAPSLPKRPAERPYHRLTLDWWKAIWKSPMAPEFLKSDTFGLFRLAELVDQYAYEPEMKLGAEIARQEQRFGLSPLDRRRLQWEIERVNEAERKRPAPRPAPTADQVDPRAFLSAV